MFEESLKQLNDSISIQITLADKLEDSEKKITDFYIKEQNSENDKIEKINELQSKLFNCEGLVNAYENEIKKNKDIIFQLENDIKISNQMLNEAKNQIQNEKNELFNLETVRKDLEAQRCFYTENIQSNDLKGICYFLI